MAIKVKGSILVIVMLGVAMFASSCGDRSTAKKIKNTLTIAYRMPVSTDDQPWMMVRGIYAFGPKYVIIDSVTQEKRQALIHLGGSSLPGLVQTDAMGAYFAAEAARREGELQRNMFAAVVTQAGATKETGFLDDNGNFHSIESIVRRAARLLDVTELSASSEVVPGREGNEIGWSLIMLANSNLVIARWDNYLGVLTGTEDILRIALSRPVDWGTDEGFIEQLGIASVLRAYKLHKLEEEISLYRAELKNGQKKEIPAPALDSVALDGVWAEAQEHVDNVVKTLREYQIDDGSFSASWHSEKRRADNPDERVLYTGYALDYLSLALPYSEIDAPWVKKTVSTLCAVIKQNRFQLYEKIWPLSQAAHALRVYNDRLKEEDNPILVEPEFESDELPPSWDNKEDRKKFNFD